MMNRRALLTTLGGAAGGFLSRGHTLLGQPPACQPKNGAVDLSALYAAPSSNSDGITKLKTSFEKGLKKVDPALGIGPKIDKHLAASYGDAFEEKRIQHLFDENGAKHAALWVVAIDHAFILGQLAANSRKTDANGNLGPLKPRDVVRAQLLFRRATSSAECDCFINTKKFYELPAAPPPVYGTPLPTLNCDGSPTKASGQIDEECPFCD